ncbi:hypothetical protein ACIBVL_40830 [Streptomyces sp. NPDC049687]|uniref:hypothetical protein n=1 Tax=Streptomyces sp. NPDC049687 TaxID=3365596 RepID=UPI0037900DDD
MSAAARRTAYALTGITAVLLALVAFASYPSSSADAAVATPVVKSKYFTSETTISCPSGWTATGGGVGVDDPSTMYVARTEPRRSSSGKPVGWKGTLSQRTNGRAATGTVYVVCAP